MGDNVVIPGPGEQPDDEGRDLLDWDLLFDFHAMIETLQETDGIVEVHSKVHDPVPAFTIETIEHGLGMRVPARVKSFYQVTDGLEFSWSYEKDSEIRPGGGAHLFDFATVFDNWLGTLWEAGAEHSDEEQDFFWSLRGFDHGCEADSAHMVVMCVEEEYPTYDLFVHELDQRTSHLLELTFREYFDCLLASRGTFGWRALLTEDAATDSPRADEFFEVTARFFPHADLSAWKSA